jgi:hypothetical protein
VDVVVYDDMDKRYVPLLVAIGSALLAAMIVGGLSYELGRSEPSAPLSSVSESQDGGVTEPQAGSAADPTCSAAVERADAAVAIGERLERSLAGQTSLMDELLAGRATSEQVLDEALPPLTASAKDRQAFLEAVTAYREARADCQP